MGRSVAHCELSRLRKTIDQTDRQLLRLLSRRWRLIEAIARTKANADAVHDPVRSRQILARIQRSAAQYGLPPDVAAQLWSLMLELSVVHQRSYLEKRGRAGLPD